MLNDDDGPFGGTGLLIHIYEVLDLHLSFHAPHANCVPHTYLHTSAMSPVCLVSILAVDGVAD